MLGIRGPSGWTYDTSAGVSLSVLFVGGASGTLVLIPPYGGHAWYRYEYYGVAYGVGFHMNAASSTTDSFSAGKIYILNSFRGGELDQSDLEGVCLVAEMSVSAGIGGSGTAMLLGIPPEYLEREIGSDLFHLLLVAGSGGAGQMVMNILNAAMPKLMQTYSKAVLIMGGFNTSGVSAGVQASIGYLSVRAAAIPPVTDDHSIRKETWEPTHTWNSSHDASYVEIPGDALFDFGKWNIKPAAEQVLQKVGAILKNYPRRILVEGHTDIVERQPGYNMQLSMRRATAVKQWLLTHQYRKDSEVETIGYGATRPVAPNDKPEGRQKNRRVKIVVYKN